METGRGRIARLTKRVVDGAAPEGQRFIVWDRDLKGFGLRVEPSGAKTFLVRYRVGGGRRGTRRQFKIGSYGALTPDQARQRAEEVLATVELGGDPQAGRVEARKALTVAELCDLYLAEGVATKKASTIALDQIRIAGHLKPSIGTRKITELKPGDVERMMMDIAAGAIRAPVPEGHTGPKPPGSRARGGKTAATKSVKLLRAMYRFAAGRKLCLENPTEGVKTFTDGRRERFLSPAELGRLGEALSSAECSADELPGWQKAARLSHVTILRLLLLSGARKNEIARLKRSEIRDGGAWVQLEDSKTGRKVIKLGAAAQVLLNSVPETVSAYVFPDPRDPGRPVRNIDWAWVGIRGSAGLDDVRIHDLRHSFASVGLAGGSGLFLIGKLLGHSHVATTQRYAHLADDPVKAAADRISAMISAQLAGRQPDVDAMPEAANG